MPHRTNERVQNRAALFRVVRGPAPGRRRPRGSRCETEGASGSTIHAPSASSTTRSTARVTPWLVRARATPTPTALLASIVLSCGARDGVSVGGQGAQSPILGPGTADEAGCVAPEITEALTRFAVIGDYGEDGPGEAAVAALVRSFGPDFVVTAGDNNYPSGEAATIDANIGKHYAEFICPYRGAYGSGSRANRFFPAPGNHDWYTFGLAPYLEYFELPGNER